MRFTLDKRLMSIVNNWKIDNANKSKAYNERGLVWITMPKQNSHVPATQRQPTNQNDYETTVDNHKHAMGQDDR